MNPLLKIFSYIAVVLLCGILISPPAYWFCQWLISHGWLEFLENFPFHRYFSRTVQVSALVLLIPLILWLNIRKFSEFGIYPNPRRWNHLGMGFVFAFAPMAILAVIYVAMDIYGIRGEPRWNQFPRIIGAAVAVSVIEELFFRGVILGLAVRSFGVRWGAVFSAVVFAVMHFLRPARLPDEGPITWLSGLEQLGRIFHDLPQPAVLGFGLLTLFAVGILLAAVTIRTRSLWVAIGLHAGWIFGQQGFIALARFRPDPETALLPWVGPNVVSGAVPTGLLPLVILLLTGAIVWMWLKKQSAHAAS